MIDELAQRRLRRAIAAVLWNVSNYPRPAQPHLLGQDTGPLTDKVLAAVNEALALNDQEQ